VSASYKPGQLIEAERCGKPAVGVSGVLVWVIRGDQEDFCHGPYGSKQFVVAVADQLYLVKVGKVSFAAGDEALPDHVGGRGDVDEDAVAGHDVSDEGGHVLVGEPGVAAVQGSVDEFAEEASVEDEPAGWLEQAVVGGDQIGARRGER
jgi:hypothetical protein